MAKKPVDKNAWMNTYSDMVTLLLCFFVMLFAASSVDAGKWAILVQALNPNAKDVSQIVTENVESEGTDPFTAGGDSLLTDVQEFQDLYYQLDSYIQEKGMTADVEIFGGEGYTFIVFRNDIFFDGNSSVLKKRGQEVLTFLCGGIKPIQEKVKEMHIYGHTNQADPNRPNNIEDDRFLAAERAARVLVFIQEKNVIAAKKLCSTEYGQHYPIASFTKAADRAKNRRVEILITETDGVAVTLEEVYKQIDSGQVLHSGPGNQGEAVTKPGQAAPKANETGKTPAPLPKAPAPKTAQ